MGLEKVSETAQYHLPLMSHVFPGKNIWYGRVAGSKTAAKDPEYPVHLVGGYLRITGGDAATIPNMDHDESGVVIKGQLTLEDETGQKVVLREGEAFFLHRNGTYIFSADEHALAFKASAYPGGKEPTIADAGKRED